MFMLSYYILLVFFFFKQKTAYEMRISDWSSDVCSSDLPVTEEVLSNPPRGEWVNWRQSRGASGYSPLDQINSSNVGTLRLAWSLSIPGGPLETAPLVHDGIMFVPTAGARVQAIDAKTGRSEEHTSELQSLMRISYAVFCLKPQKNNKPN